MKTERDKFAEMFADYMIEAMARTRMRQSEIARATGLSRTTISQIVGKKPHTLTGKLLLPERETVDKIARAFGDPVAIARQAAGYSSEGAQPEPLPQEPEPADRTAEAARAAEMIENFLQLSPDRQAELLGIIRVMQGDPELLGLLKGPIKIVKAEDINASELELLDEEEEKDTG